MAGALAMPISLPAAASGLMGLECPPYPTLTIPLIALARYAVTGIPKGILLETWNVITFKRKRKEHQTWTTNS